MDPFQKMQREDITDLSEPKHVNYFFQQYGDPCYTLITYEDIEEYLSGFEYWGFEDKLKLDFLYHIKKHFKKISISLMNFNYNKIDELEEHLNNKELGLFTSDTCMQKILYSTLHIFEIVDVSKIKKDKKEKLRKEKKDIIKKSLLNTTEKVNTTIKLIENEIELHEKKDYSGKKVNEKKYKMLWEDIVDEHFKNENIIAALDDVGYEKEEEFKAFMKKMYERRTTEEWMKYYDQNDLTHEIIGRQKKELEPKEAINFTRNLMNRNYSKSTVGTYLKENLKRFEEKYVKGEKNIENRELEIPDYDFDYIEIEKYADSLEIEKAIEYLQEIEKKVINKDDFNNELDKLIIESDLRTILNNKKLQRDIKRAFNIGRLDTYDFSEPYIMEYLNELKTENERIIYLEYVLKELEKNVKNLEYALYKNKDDKTYYSTFYRRTFRHALMYGIHKHEKEGLDTDIEKNKQLIIIEQRLNITRENLREELEFIKKAKTEFLKNINRNEGSKEENAKYKSNEELDDLLDESEKEPTQRKKIKKYLDDKKIDIKNDFNLNVKELARDITKHLYPAFLAGREKKIETIRQELMLMRKR